jgi:hypothetical protein
MDFRRMAEVLTPARSPPATAASAVQRGMLAAVAGGWKLVAGWRTSVLHSFEDPPFL